MFMDQNLFEQNLYCSFKGEGSINLSILAWSTGFFFSLIKIKEFFKLSTSDIIVVGWAMHVPIHP